MRKRVDTNQYRIYSATGASVNIKYENIRGETRQKPRASAEKAPFSSKEKGTGMDYQGYHDWYTMDVDPAKYDGGR